MWNNLSLMAAVIFWISHNSTNFRAILNVALAMYKHHNWHQLLSINIDNVKETNDVFIVRVASVAFSLATIVCGAVTIN